MPLYDYSCPMCGIRQAIFKRIAQLDAPEACAECSAPMTRAISAPMVRGDYAGYSCPITGDWILGRRAHEENLRKHGCRLLEPGESYDREKAKAHEEESFLASIGETVEEEIARLPARKREALAAEMESGLDAVVSRVDPTITPKG